MLSFSSPPRWETTVPSASTPQAQHLVAVIAVAQEVETARVRGDHAADGRRLAGAEVDAVAPARPPAACRESVEGDPGARGDLAGHRVDRAEPVEAAQVEDDLAVQRHRAADQAGVAALGHERDAAPARHAATTAATSAVSPGRTTAGRRPGSGRSSRPRGRR